MIKFIDLSLYSNLLRCDSMLCPTPSYLILSYLTLPHYTSLLHTLSLHCHCYCCCYWFHHFYFIPLFLNCYCSDYNQSPRNMYQCQMGKQVRYAVRSIIDTICVFHFKLQLTAFKSNRKYLTLSLLLPLVPSWI